MFRPLDRPILRRSFDGASAMGMAAGGGDTAPPHEEALRRFRAYLVRHRMSPDPLWIFREDVRLRGGSFLVRQPLPDRNARLAAAHFERGRQGELGVRMEVLCMLGTQGCCYVWCPENPREKDYGLLLISRFAMSMPLGMRPARSVAHPVAWMMQSLRKDDADGSGVLARLPSRAS